MEILEINSQTLHSAMRLMGQDGLIERRQGIGTRLLKTKLGGRRIWNIGIAGLSGDTVNFWWVRERMIADYARIQRKRPSNDLLFTRF